MENQNETKEKFKSTRFDYVQYSEASQAYQAGIKAQFIEVELSILALGQGRASSIALTKIEEAYAWCGKAIRDAQIQAGIPSDLSEGRSSS